MAARRSRTRRVLRERNECGFALFVQNLKSVINIFTRVEEQELETDILIETRHRLLDAAGTLSLLLNDISRGGINPTGVPSNDIQVPVENLKVSLTQLINLLSVLIENNNNTDFDDEVDVCYSAPLDTTRDGPGRKRYEISKDQLEHLRSLFFSWEKISSILQVSVSTIQR